MSKLFETLKKNQYIINMENAAKTQLSLLNTLNELQSEYEKLFAENNKLKLDIIKLKEDRK